MGAHHEMLASRRVFAFALVTQSLLIVTAWLLARVLDLEPRWGNPRRDIWIGIGGAAALGAANYLLLVHGPHNWIVAGVRAVYHEVLIPLFSRFSPFSIVVIGVFAGIGEEWLFRGVLQPVIGLFATSVLFGLAHVGNRSMAAFGVWAAGMGFLLGVLAQVTGGLIAPMVAHGVYDMLALAYIRRGAMRA
jgi:membrane protease YdiL (CAAX protease family)